MLSLLSSISYRQVYWSRKRESALAILHAEAPKRREEKRERDYKEVRSMNFVTSFTEYNKDKVLVDVATSLVVNHINLGVVFIVLCLCLCLW